MECLSHTHTLIRLSVQSNYNHVNSIFFLSFPSSFDSRPFSAEKHPVLTLFSTFFLPSHSVIQSSPIFQNKRNTLCVHASIFYVLCASICYVLLLLLFLFPSVSLSLPQHCAASQQKFSDSSCFSFFFPPVSLLHSPPHLPGSSFAISAQRLPSFSCAW